MVDTQSCSCHTGPYAPCDYPGGCGTTGGCCSRRPAACSTCAVYRPDADPRIPNRPPVCDGDRNLLDRHLADIGNLHADLAADEPAQVDQRRYERFDRKGASLGHTWSDPLTAVGGVAPIPSRSKQPSVTGSRERPIPIRVDRLDLAAPARVHNPTWQSKTHPEDHAGHLAVASTLDQWVRDWRDTLWPDHTLPAAAVGDLVAWLRNRVDDACDRHPAITEFAEEIRSMRSALRGAAGDHEAPPEPCEGVACRRCDLLTLYREPGGDVTCINPDCRAVLRDTEYHDWTKTLAAEARVKRHADQKT